MFYRFGRLSLLILFACGTALHADPAADLVPLASSAPEGLGPVALIGLNSIPVGVANVFGGARPDLFVITRGGASGLYVLPYLRTGENDAPIFHPPRQIRPFHPEAPFFVYQTQDGTIHSAWIDHRILRFAELDRSTLTFEAYREVAINALPAGAANVAVFPGANGALRLVFELSGENDPARTAIGQRHLPDWRPYDASGISAAPTRHRYLVTADLPADAVALASVRTITPTRREVFWGMIQLAPLSLGPEQPTGLLVGSRRGMLSYYPSIDSITPRTLAADPHGIALRHPSIDAGPTAYPASVLGPDHIIVGGDSSLYFYRATGRLTSHGAPIFHDPTPLLQINADLYAGTLPTPSVVDWDGDGVTDLIVGNSEGFILFFKNIGTDETPRFLPGERLRAADRDIHHQAGYSGSVQGTEESRWGYVSPTVFDWNEDGLPDLVVGDITGDYVVYLNRGTRTAPALEPARPLYCDGLNLHGTWRCRPGVGRMGDRIALIIPDGDGELRLYWKIDDYNVEDAGKLRLEDGTHIGTNSQPAGGSGRVKLDLYDIDQDGLPDLVIGTGRRGAIPNRETGYPSPTLGWRSFNTLLVMRNVGTLERPVFAAPVAVAHLTHGIVQPGGTHEAGFAGTRLGGGPATNFIAANEAGRLFLLRGQNLRLLNREEAATYRDKHNPFPVPPQ